MPLFDPPSVGQSTLKDCSLSRLGHQGSGGGVPKKNPLFDPARARKMPVPLTANAITHMDIYGYRGDSPSVSQCTLKDCTLATKEVGKERKKKCLFLILPLCGNLPCLYVFINTKPKNQKNQKKTKKNKKPIISRLVWKTLFFFLVFSN